MMTILFKLFAIFFVSIQSFVIPAHPVVLEIHGDGQIKTEFRALVLDTPQTQKQGLSGKTWDEFPGDHAAIFLFEKPQLQYFWMKDMRFPLDFLWVRDNQIIGIDENIPEPASNNNEIYRINSNDTADMVIELHAGTVKEFSIKIGDQIFLK